MLRGLRGGTEGTMIDGFTVCFAGAAFKHCPKVPLQNLPTGQVHTIPVADTELQRVPFGGNGLVMVPQRPTDVPQLNVLGHGQLLDPDMQHFVPAISVPAPHFTPG